jgi:hypothetical protein
VIGKRVEYSLALGPDDRYRHVHVRLGPEIVYFRLQLETRIRDRWEPVVRYDSAHGFAHRDLLDHSGNVQKTPLFNMDYNEALTFAENDLKANWNSYKRRFMGDVG